MKDPSKGWKEGKFGSGVWRKKPSWKKNKESRK